MKREVALWLHPPTSQDRLKIPDVGVQSRHKPRQNVTNNKFNIVLVWENFVTITSDARHQSVSCTVTSEDSLKHFELDKHTCNSTSVLTWSPEEEKHTDPVDPEEHEADEGPERLQDEQWKVDEHFTCHMEQGEGEGHTLPQEEHHEQENYLKDYTKRFLAFSQVG